MKTAVDWLFEEITDSYYRDLIKKAKKIEKKQIIEAFKEGVKYWNGDEWKLIDIEDYYNKTYKK
jgi:hypothetical protein